MGGLDKHFLVLSFLVTFARQNPLSPDTVKFYHDISTGKGLYSPNDGITLLNVTDFKTVIFDESKPRAWFVEFYNSWCGHCHRFAPIWKALALDVSGWSDVIGIAAVDCSNSNNTPLCRDYEIMHYPMIKYFPFSSSKEYLGKPINQGTVEGLRHTMITEFVSDLADTKVSEPNLLPFSGKSLNELWENVPESVNYMILVIEEETSFLGSELAFDLMKNKNLETRISLWSNQDFVRSLGIHFDGHPPSIPIIKLIDRNLSLTPVRINVEGNDTRLSAYTAVKRALKNVDIELEDLKTRPLVDDQVADIAQIMQMMQIEDQIKKKLDLKQLSDVVFQVDIEGALKHSLFNEIPAHKIINGNAAEALKAYLKVLRRYFPFRKEGVKFLARLEEEVNKMEEIGGSDFEKMVTHYEKKFEPVFLSPGGWLGCRGSTPHYRGFPCGLWLMFHTLTVHAEQHKDKYPDTSPREVLEAMLGYVKHFFGCTDCSQHFQQMAVTIQEKVDSLENSILWLWESHNKVNKRLAKDKTEDPQHPKVQFPTSNLCSNCSLPNETYSRDNVLVFLRAMYTNISYLHLDELPPEKPVSTSESGDSVVYNRLMSNRIMNDDVRYVAKEESKIVLQFNFNILDVSLCVILYVFSIGIIILVCIKFFLKRGYKKKAYAYDLFHKV